MEFELGRVWYQKFYRSIADSQGYSEIQDQESRDLLSKLLDSKPFLIDPDILYDKIKDVVIVFGAGPSLDEDLSGLNGLINKAQAVIAADGAANALYSNGRAPDVLISDLDSCNDSILRAHSESKPLFVHAHGDNMQLLTSIVPLLGSSIFGTTQVQSIPNVKNVGGFTDGDRSCYLVANFDPDVVILAGMDFGREEGAHSKDKLGRVNAGRHLKLEWGRRSLEYLIQVKPKISFFNVTLEGEEISGARRSSYDQVIREFA